MGTLSEAFKKIVPLDFESTKAVPESHVWPEAEMFPSFPSPDDDHHDRKSEPKSKPESSGIHVIDLTDPNVVELIGHACETWGLFQLTNHGIPSRLIQEVESQARRLFALPTQQKLKALRSPGSAGGYGVAHMSAFFAKKVWHEGFTISGSPAGHASALWPNNYVTFCDIMEEYREEMKALSSQLMLLLLKRLQVSEDELNWKLPACHGSLQLNSYPACPEPKSTLGLFPHTDSMLMTVVHQSHEGLQVFHDEFGLVTVSPVEGALVVNLGSLMEFLSNGKFRCSQHRVLANQNNHRISAAYFFTPPSDSEIAPFAKLGSPVYRSLTMKEFLQVRAKHMEDTLSVLRL